MADRPKVGLIGARRGRQGLGPHLARQLEGHGADVAVFLGTSEATVAEAAEQLAAQGVTARGTTDLDDLLAEPDLAALVIASPVGHHAAYLERGLDAGLHVLCEKPLLAPSERAFVRVHEFEQAFERAGLALFENCQWPLVLPAFDALHAGVRSPTPRSFSMHLGPTSRGREMLVDALSHPLSLVQALVPDAGRFPRALEFSTLDPDAGTLRASFVLPYPGGDLRVDVTLTCTPEQPRPAGFAVDGVSAERRVRMDDYALFLEAGGRRVPLPDPMDALVGRFVEAIRRGPGAVEAGPWNRGLVVRQGWFDYIVRAFDAGTEGR